MSKLKIIVLVVAVSLLMAAAFVQAENSSVSSNVLVYARIMEALSVTFVENMNFGAGTADGGVVTLVPSTTSKGTISTTDYDYWDTSDTIQASCGIAGRLNHNYAVVIGSEPITYGSATSSTSIVITDGTTNMTVDRFNVISDNGQFKLSSAGGDVLHIGAVLTVPAGATVGFYEGQFNLTVSYE